ncbi:MAG: NADH-quinone oxidoreductase subunit NuoN [Pseudobdellovibrionaceae bacterium]
MTQTFQNADAFSWFAILPVQAELFLAVGGLLLLMAGAFWGKAKAGAVMSWSLVAIAISLLAVVSDIYSGRSNSPVDTLGGMLIADDFSNWMKLMILGGVGVSLLLSVQWLKENNLFTFEYPLLVLFSGVGMLFMVSANNLLALYVSLELSSLCLYVLASINRDNLFSSEAGLKYFILGALSSGLLLFGISLVYGYTGSISYAEIASVLGGASVRPLGALVGMVFILAGIAFKISAVPFHMWTPDVYQGAPTPVTALFAIVPKVAAFALLIRLLTGPFMPLSAEANQILVFVSVASMVLGGFAGLVQNNVKRLLAYSSIANMGYALLGLLSGTPEGVAAVIIYLGIYMVTVAGVFAVLMTLRRNGQALEDVKDLAGLSVSSPMKAYAMAALLFSMSGIPPLAGFFGKLFVFQAAVSAGYFAVAVIGVLSSVVGAYYYLRLIKVMFFDEQVEALEPCSSRSRRIVALAALAFVVLFTILPNALLAHAQLAAGSLFP